jgi:hypothetical protein
MSLSGDTPRASADDTTCRFYFSSKDRILAFIYFA